MQRRFLIVVIMVFCASTIHAQTSTLIRGKILYDGPPVEVRFLDVDADVEACSGDIPDESLIVDNATKALKNAVIYLENAPAQPGWTAETASIMDQINCTFIPHVVIVPAGESLTVRNSDGILHNFHTYSDNNRSVNLAMPKTMTEMEVAGRRFRRTDFISTKCDIHSWMSAVIVVAEHPYYAISDDSGEFELKDVPPGEYRLVVWHETLSGTSQSITVGAGESQEVEITLSVE